jgi:hypothetical protein
MDLKQFSRLKVYFYSYKNRINYIFPFTINMQNIIQEIEKLIHHGFLKATNPESGV